MKLKVIVYIIYVFLNYNKIKLSNISQHSAKLLKVKIHKAPNLCISIKILFSKTTETLNPFQIQR